MIHVIDYGAGNLRSVENALMELKVPYAITSQVDDLARASAIILPGVGHFGQMMRSLERLELIAPLRDAIGRGVPYLGICLGMQALYESSEEAPSLPGLGVLSGTIRRFPQGLKVPHMGWNKLGITPGIRMFEGIEGGSYVYFAHSYYLPVNDPSSGETRGGKSAAQAVYGFRFVAAIEDRNVHGVQFHPEKSGEIGLHILRNFAEGC